MPSVAPSASPQPSLFSPRDEIEFNIDEVFTVGNEGGITSSDEFITALSDLLGSQVSLTTRSPPSFPLSTAPSSAPDCFQTRQDLLFAVDLYLDNLGNTVPSFAHPQGDISSWCTTNIQDFSEAFAVARNPSAAFFDAFLGWDMSKATSLRSMFQNADAFTGLGLESWDVSSVTNFGQTFKGTVLFSGDLSAWNVGHGQNFQEMFQNTGAFGTSTDFSNWSVSNGMDFSGVFQSAQGFTGQGIDNWVFGPEVVDMQSAFRDTPLFGENLCFTWGLQLDSVTDFNNIFLGSGCEDISDPVFDVDAGFFTSFCGTCTIAGL